MERVRKTSETAGPHINVLNTTVTTTGDIGEVTVDWNIVEVVKSLGALITRDGLCDKEMRRRIGMGKAAMGGCMRWDARDRDRWRSATSVVARGRTRLDGTRWI